jgi:hypothetical protein
MQGRLTEIGVARQALVSTIQALINLLDNLEPDPDIEETDAEDELLSARAIAAAQDNPGCIASNPGDTAWIERPEQKRKPLPNGCWANVGNSEDAERDDEDCCAAADDDPGRMISDGKAGDEDDQEEDDPGGGNVTDDPHDPYSEDGL